ncbi:hypothetical protein Tco_1323886 [Tanacetum coccineum]
MLILLLKHDINTHITYVKVYQIITKCNVTSETPALQSVKGRSKGGNRVGNGIGRSGGVPDGGVSDGSIPDRGDGSGSGWEVDGDSALN